MNVTIILDVSCPWCLVGMRKFEQAMKERPGVVTNIQILPYFINPDMPAKGRDRNEHYRNKFGPGDRYAKMRDLLEVEGKKAGINFDLRGDCVVANTLNAHRLILWAGGQEIKSPGISKAIALALMNAYFIDRRNLGDHQVLADIAEDVGLDQTLVLDLLGTDKDADRVVSQVQYLIQKGVTGVPFYIIGDKGSLSGAQDASAFISIFDKRAEQAV